MVATAVINAAPATPAPATPAPTVTSVLRYGYHWMPTTLVLGFSQPLDAASAQDAANYRVVAPDGRPIGIAVASYDAASRTVTLHPNQRLNVHHRYRLTVNGQALDGLRGVLGSSLDGQGGNHPGTNFTTFVGPRDLVIGGRHPFGATLGVAARSAHSMFTPLAARPGLAGGGDLAHGGPRRAGYLPARDEEGGHEPILSRDEEGGAEKVSGQERCQGQKRCQKGTKGVRNDFTIRGRATRATRAGFG
jgi:hypothetical protein